MILPWQCCSPLGTLCPGTAGFHPGPPAASSTAAGRNEFSICTVNTKDIHSSLGSDPGLGYYLPYQDYYN